MAPRISTAELALRTDSLALCVFGLLPPLLDALAEVHPDGNGVVRRARDLAMGMLDSAEAMADGPYSEETYERARLAIWAATATTAAVRAEVGSNDNGDSPR